MAEPPKGYVADDVKDPAAFGLDRPAITVELKTTRGDAPLVLDIGKTVPDEPERVYLRQGGQDDVVAVDARALSEIPENAVALSSQQIAEIVPAAVTEFEIGTSRGDVFKLKKDRGGWDLISPRKERADTQAVQQFLGHIDDLQTSEFLEPKVVPNPMLDPPVMRIRIRQAAGDRASREVGGRRLDPGPRPAAGPQRHRPEGDLRPARGGQRHPGAARQDPRGAAEEPAGLPRPFDRHRPPGQDHEAHRPPGWPGRRARAREQGRGQRLADAPAGGGPRRHPDDHAGADDPLRPPRPRSSRPRPPATARNSAWIGR